MQKAKRWLARIGIGFAVLVMLLALLGFDYVRSFARSVPNYDGTVQVAGVSAAVTIARDRYAIPHITGSTPEDAAFGLGYAHADDRLFQMEMSRRYVQGRLSELVGSLALSTDIMMRSIGLYPTAQAALTHIAPHSRSLLKAYAAGVNAAIAHHKGPWPIDVALTAGKPEPWTEADSLAILKGMDMQLSGNMFGEIARVRLMARLGRQGVQDFFPPFGEAPLPAYLDSLFHNTQLGDARGVPNITASNNWTVDGAHSVTGKPLLANDPHLGFDIPAVWYLAHLAYPGHDLVGGTLAGAPSVVIGHNRHVAWGLTNTGPDTQDLFLEQINPDNPGEYRTPGGWEQFTVRSELIKVRFGAARRILVRSTRHGPVLPSASAFGIADLVPKGYVLSLAWTALADDDTTIDTLADIADAKDAASFKSATARFVAPMQNLIYADDGGQIGLILPGRVPLRNPGDDSLGLVPAPGWDARYDWQGFIATKDWASIENPASGRIVTANNKTVPEGYGFTLTHEWDNAYRHDRIDALLAAKPQQSVESFAAIQRDPVDLYALQLKPYLMAAAPFDDLDATAAAMLKDWDGAMWAAKPEPLIYSAWARALAKRIYADELGDAFQRMWDYRPEFTLRVLSNTENEGRWCDDRTTPETEICTTAIRLALKDAVAELTAAYGPDPSRWRWGDAHKAVQTHRLFGSFPIVGSIFNRETEMDGGAFTVLRADHRMSANRPYAADHGAGYRAIYDLANPDNSQFIIAMGESGNLYSPHYDDLLPVWAHYGYVTIPTAPDAIAKSAVHKMVLEPVTASTH